MFARHRFGISKILALSALAALIGLGLYGAGMAQGEDVLEESSDSGIDVSDISALEFRTYELGWVRYRNVDSDGELKLVADESVKFPFERFNNGPVSIRIADLESPGYIEDLIEKHGIEYNEDDIVGNCDPNKLKGNSADVFCVPGTRGMEHGNIFLVLYNPDTNDIAAITTTIDNNAGGALRESWIPTATPEPQVVANAGSCGHYTSGQWVSALDHDVSGLGVPIVGAGDNVASYQCIVPENGQPYFQAHNNAPSGSNDKGGDSSGSKDNGSSSRDKSGSRDDSGSNGRVDPSDPDEGDTSVGIIVTDEPDECPSLFGCDGDNIEE